MAVPNQASFHMALAGVHVNCMFRFSETRNFFRRYSVQGAGDPEETVCVTDRAFSDWGLQGNPIDAFGEFCLLCQPVSEALMRNSCCVFHAAALRYNDRAVLIAGGSGTGKSTHCRLLLEKHPEEFSVINGDKPVLEHNGSDITVHPSPWNGKEGMKGAEAAPLAGIFLLQRGGEDSIKACTERETALFSFLHVFQSFETEDVIRMAGEMTEKIAKSAPGFFFNSSDMDRSSELLYEAVREVCSR